MLSIFKPAPHKARLPAAEIDPTYRRLRWQIFTGYSLAMPRIIWCARTLPSRCPTRRTGFFTRRSGLCAVRDFHRLWFFEIYNGFGVRSLESARFSAGRVDSGRSSHVVYGLCAVGDIQHRRDVCTVVPLRLVQGMGWPPCGRTMVHWWSQKERGGIVSVWNCAHNVGGGIPPLLFLLGMAWFNDWKAALYMPAFGAIVVALFAFAMMRDTPQSCGLPPIEEYKNDYPDDYNEKAEEELTAKQIFMQYVLPNKLLWYIAIANVFVYLLRYGILDWSPTYLKEVKHFALDKSSWPTSCMNTRVFRARCCVAGCRIKSSAATVARPACSL